MSEAGLPRLVFERWTDPVAGDMLEAAEIDIFRLDRPPRPKRSGMYWNPPTLPGRHPHRRRIGGRWVTVVGRPVVGGTLQTSIGRMLGRCRIRRDRRRSLTRAGIAVCNNSGPGAEAVAEHALGFMLDLAKKITVADRVLRGGELGDRLALRGSQLLGKTLGVIGLGAIGSRLVELCAPF